MHVQWFVMIRLLPYGSELITRQLREDSEVDHYVELTKGEKKEASLPTTKELKWFTYFGDELHTLRDMNDDFAVRVASEREE